MPKYRWTITFDADDDKDAARQAGEAMDAFDSVHGDELHSAELEQDGDAGKGAA